MREYLVSYRYVSPHPAGPFRGRNWYQFPDKPKRQQEFFAMFGRAVITSVSRKEKTESRP